jgi:integrase
MANVEYLTQRDDTYYVRIVVPEELREKVGRRELKRSLKTKSKSEAISRYPIVLAELQAELNQPDNDVDANAQIRPVDLKQLFSQVHDKTQASELEMRERVFRCLSTNQTEEKLWDFHDPVPSEYKPYLNWVMAEGNVDEIARFLSLVRGRYHIEAQRQRYQIGDVADLKAKALQAIGDDADIKQLRAAMKTVMEAEIAALKALDDQSAGVSTQNSAPNLDTPSIATREQSLSQGPLLTEAVLRWGELHDWEPKTRRERETVMGFFVEICGDRPIGAYTKEDGRTVRDVFRFVPPNAHKMSAFKDLGIAAISKSAQKGDFKQPAPKNVNDKLNVISAFFNWAQNEYDVVARNPIQGLKLAVKQRARDQREPFRIDELNQLFRSPVFTGCRSTNQWSVPGKIIPKDSHLFWVPPIALFTGMRLSEIVFLEVSDIDDVDGVLSFRVRESSTRRLKTASSKRDLPVHRALVEIGLREFVRKQQKRGGRLFEQVEIGPADNPISPESKRMNRLLKMAGLVRDRTSFHSFRHTFEDGCRNSGIPLEVINALQGHSEGGMAGRYGRGYSVKVLNDHIHCSIRGSKLTI